MDYTHLNTIFGNHYYLKISSGKKQGLKLCFDPFPSEDDEDQNNKGPYVCFKKAPDDWKLETGEKLPDKIVFTNASYDADTRSFKGDINFNPPSNTKVTKWECVMIFSADFTHIESGH